MKKKWERKNRRVIYLIISNLKQINYENKEKEINDLKNEKNKINEKKEKETNELKNEINKIN